LIYGVSITASLPFITKWPLDIYPDRPITVEGDTFGSSPGQIEITFSRDAHFTFSGGSKTELPLNVSKSDWDSTATPNTAKSQKMTDASSKNDVPEQPVTIAVRTADGRVSEGRPATFHNDAVITKGPNTVTPKGAFNLVGWDFGEPGTVEIHFKENPYSSPSLDSHLNLQPSKIVWQPWAMNVTMPDVTAVAGQDVEISFTTKDGRKSNAWPATFVPEMVLASGFSVLPVACGNDGVFNWCNDSNSSHFCWFSTPDPSDPPNGMPDRQVAILGFHSGCASVGSYDGTDQYWASYTNGWTIENLFFFPYGLDNGTVNEINSPTPTNNLHIDAQWHIGADGGAVNYYGDVYIKGPKGVPSE